MGQAKPASGLPDAASGRAADFASDDAAELGFLARFGADQSGATAIEYAVMASGIGVCVAATVVAVGGGVKNFFTTLTGMFP